MKKNKFITYALYAIGEVVLIVFGILIAVEIDESRKEKEKREEEVKILTEVKYALESDVNDIMWNIAYHDSIVNSCKILIEVIDNDLPYDDSYNKLFALSTQLSTFVNNTSAYETLKAKGVDLVRNDSLRTLIFKYYDQELEFQLEIERMTKDIFANFSFLEYQLFKNMNPFGEYEPWDFEELKKNRVYRGFLSQTSVIREFQSGKYRKMYKTGQELINMIDKEIALKEK